MSDALTIPAAETGKVRVFALDMPPERAKFLREPGAADQVLGQLPGGAPLNPAYVEVFPIADLEQLGLAGYLHEGCGIPTDQIAPDRERLQALTGHVMLVYSRAFDGQATQLTPAPELRLIATYGEPRTDWHAPAPLETDSARPRASASQAPRAARARARRIGAGIFVFFMALIALTLVLVLT